MPEPTTSQCCCTSVCSLHGWLISTCRSFLKECYYIVLPIPLNRYVAALQLQLAVYGVNVGPRWFTYPGRCVPLAACASVTLPHLNTLGCAYQHHHVMASASAYCRALVMHMTAVCMPTMLSNNFCPFLVVVFLVSVCIAGTSATALYSADDTITRRRQSCPSRLPGRAELLTVHQKLCCPHTFRTSLISSTVRNVMTPSVVYTGWRNRCRHARPEMLSLSLLSSHL